MNDWTLASAILTQNRARELSEGLRRDAERRRALHEAEPERRTWRWPWSARRREATAPRQPA